MCRRSDGFLGNMSGGGGVYSTLREIANTYLKLYSSSFVRDVSLVTQTYLILL